MSKAFWVIIGVLVLGGYLIKTSIDTTIEEDEDKSFIIEYGTWLLKVAKNIKSTVGYVIKQDWLPETNMFNNTEEQTNQTGNIS